MRKITALQWMSIWLFPALQISAFVAFCIGINQNIWPIVFLPISAFFLNFSLHITYHYTVHFPLKKNGFQMLMGVAKSVLIGMPFHYYSMYHWNHHRQDNNLDDFTSTWENVNGEVVSKNVFFYAFFWPFSSSISLPNQIKQGVREGYCNPRTLSRMRLVLAFNSLVFIVVGYFSWKWLLGYFMMVYLGWVLIALHNYGQHLPIIYGTQKANSYLSGFYNWLFVNNGLHEEHHEEPSKSYWELQPNPKTPHSIIPKPHIIEAISPAKKQG